MGYLTQEEWEKTHKEKCYVCGKELDNPFYKKVKIYRYGLIARFAFCKEHYEAIKN